MYEYSKCSRKKLMPRSRGNPNNRYTLSLGVLAWALTTHVMHVLCMRGGGGYLSLTFLMDTFRILKNCTNLRYFFFPLLISIMFSILINSLERIHCIAAMTTHCSHSESSRQGLPAVGTPGIFSRQCENVKGQQVVVCALSYCFVWHGAVITWPVLTSLRRISRGPAVDRTRQICSTF